MEYDEEPRDDDIEVDPEALLQTLLAMMGDSERREEIVRKISEKTGQIPEKVETILTATITYLSNKSRSN